MSQIEKSNKLMAFQIVSWLIWAFSFLCMIYYLLFPSLVQKTGDLESFAFNALVIIAILLSLVLFLVIFLIRKYGLRKAVEKGAFSPITIKGLIRIFLLNILSWVGIEVLAVIGLFLYFVSGNNWPVYIWVPISLASMCFLTPQLRPYLK